MPAGKAAKRLRVVNYFTVKPHDIGRHGILSGIEKKLRLVHPSLEKLRDRRQILLLILANLSK